LKAEVSPTLERLNKLMMVILNTYRTLGERWAIFMVASATAVGSAQQPVPPHVRSDVHKDDAPYLDWLFECASFIRNPFEEKMQELVDEFNQAIWPHDLGLDSAKFPFRVRRAVKQKKKRSRVGVPRGAELRVGPPKTRKRAEEKRTNDYNKKDVPAAHLLDLIRVMVVFDEPYEMSVFQSFLELRLNVVRTKNDFVEDRPAEESQYRHIICNVLFAHGDVEHVAEVQLTTQEFAQLRKWSHRPYKVERAQKAEDIIGTPIFRRASIPEVVTVAVLAHRQARRHSAPASVIGRSNEEEEDQMPPPVSS